MIQLCHQNMLILNDILQWSQKRKKQIVYECEEGILDLKREQGTKETNKIKEKTKN